MKFSVTLVFTLLFAVVVMVYARLMPPQEPEMPLEPPPVMKLLPLESGDEITGIEIRDFKENQTIAMARENEEWFLTYPVRYPAEQLLARGLVHALTLSSKARRLIPEKDWDEYGLENPAMKIGVRTRNYDEMKYLLFGDKSPVGNFIFARWEKENEYFLLNAQLKPAFERTVYSLREKRVFRIPESEVQKIRIKLGDRVYEMVKRANAWLWMEPIPLLGVEIDPNFVGELTEHLRELYIKDFLDTENKSSREMGFSLAGSLIRVTGISGESDELQLGSELPSRDAFYARRENENVYFLVARGNIRGLFEIVETAIRRMEADKPSGG